jgi:hypothetical protein
MNIAETRTRLALERFRDELESVLAATPDTERQTPWFLWAEREKWRLTALLQVPPGTLKCAGCGKTYLIHEIPTYGEIPKLNLCNTCNERIK